MASITSDKSKSELCGALLPLLNSRRVDLLDDKRLVSQLLGLERRTARGGRDSIDHAPGAHDDVINAVAGALVLTESAMPGFIEYYRRLLEEEESTLDRIEVAQRAGGRVSEIGIIGPNGQIFGLLP
jgi:hypothetical protein